MATKSIAWQKGSGNITLTFSGQGNDTALVSSDPNDVYEDRSQTLTFYTTAGEPEGRYQVTVYQGMKEPNLIDSDGNWLIDSNDTYLIV